MILPLIIVAQMPREQYDHLNNTIGQLNPDTLAQITNIAEAEMVRTYQEHGLEPPAILPAVDVVIIDDGDDDVRPGDFDQDFLLNIRGKDEKYRADIEALQAALVRAGLLLRGGLNTGMRTPLRFQLVRVLRYLTNNNKRLSPPDQYFNAHDENYAAVNIILESARAKNRQLYRHFGDGIKRILRREMPAHQLPAELDLRTRPTRQ